MTVIGFLGMYRGMPAVDSIQLGCALTVALNNNEHVLLSHLCDSPTSMEAMLARRMPSFAHLPESFAGRAGVDGLLRALSHGYVSQVHVRDYVQSILKGRLDWLPESRLHQLPSLRPAVIRQLLRQLRAEYPASLIRLPDVVVDPQYSATIDEVDVLVVCLEQNEHRLRHFFEKFHSKQHQWPERTLFIVADYDASARLNAQQLKKIYGARYPMFAIPYCTELRNAANEGEFAELFLRHLFRSERTDRGLLARCLLEFRTCVQALFDKVPSC